MADKHSTISQYVSIVQRIERELPELKMRVRFPLGAQKNNLPQGRLFLLAEWTGLEPATFCVTGRRSNQLSYHSRVLKNGHFHSATEKS